MRRLVAALATLLLLVAFLPSAAIAGEPVVYVYHGTLTGAQLNDCDGANIPVLTMGNWTATISPGFAQIDANEFHDWGDGRWVHQTAMGGAAWGKWQVDNFGPGYFDMSVLAFGVIQVDASLSSGEIFFHLEPYGDCASADVWGEVR